MIKKIVSQIKHFFTPSPMIKIVTKDGEELHFPANASASDVEYYIRILNKIGSSNKQHWS